MELWAISGMIAAAISFAAFISILFISSRADKREAARIDRLKGR